MCVFQVISSHPFFTKEFNCNFYQLQNIAENPALRILCTLFGNINFSSSQLTLPFSVITSLLFYVIQIKLLSVMNIHRCLLVSLLLVAICMKIKAIAVAALVERTGPGKCNQKRFSAVSDKEVQRKQLKCTAKLLAQQ